MKSLHRSSHRSFASLEWAPGQRTPAVMINVPSKMRQMHITEVGHPLDDGSGQGRYFMPSLVYGLHDRRPVQ